MTSPLAQAAKHVEGQALTDIQILNAALGGERGLMQQALTRHLDAAGLTAFGFAGTRCDRKVAAVLARLAPSGTSQ